MVTHYTLIYLLPLLSECKWHYNLNVVIAGYCLLACYAMQPDINKPLVNLYQATWHNIAEDGTVMCRITTFRSMTDCIYDGGPIKIIIL
jgi:hypothetical protein